MEEVIQEAVESLDSVKKPTDFYRAVLCDDKHNDSTIENGFVYCKVVERVTPNERILVINPSADFLPVYPEPLLGNTTFCMPYASMTEPLRSEFPAAAFCAVSDLCAAGDAPAYEKVLLFGRGFSSEERDRLIAAAAAALKKEGKLYALIPADDVTGEVFSAGALRAAFSIETLDILPFQSTKSLPHKKVFLQAGLGAEKGPIRVSKYEFIQDGKDVYLKKQRELPIELEPSQLCHPDKSIYTLYRHQFEKQPVKKRGDPFTYAFSEEVIFWYTVSEMSGRSTKKVEAYVCWLPSETQLKRDKLKRGRKITESEVSISSLRSQEEIEAWCRTELPYRPRIHQAVQKAFARNDKLLRSGKAQLRTLWYLQLDLTDGNTVNTVEEEIFTSPIGAIELKAELAVYESILSDFCAEKTQEYRAFCWNCVSFVLDRAVAKGYLSENPVRTVAHAMREKTDASVRAVTEALQKRTFYEDEEEKILNFLYSKIEKGEYEYLSVLIRFFTGLEPNVVSALTWNDLHRIPFTRVYQFWICQQCKNNDDRFVTLAHVEDYRRMPLAPSLAQALCERRDDIEKRLGVEGSDLNKLRIIAPDATILDPQKKNITPRKINEISKRVMEAIHIPDVILELPDEENGTKETNLAKYNSDTFRANFRLKAREYCGFTDCEKRFYMGLAQNVPFGKNYSDFLNNCSQFKMYKKLKRWDAFLRIKSAAKAERREIRLSSGVTVGGDGYRTRATLQITATEGSEDTILRIRCPGGVSAEISVVGPLPTNPPADQRSNNHA